MPNSRSRLRSALSGVLFTGPRAVYGGKACYSTAERCREACSTRCHTADVNGTRSDSAGGKERGFAECAGGMGSRDIVQPGVKQIRQSGVTVHRLFLVRL